MRCARFSARIRAPARILEPGRARDKMGPMAGLQSGVGRVIAVGGGKGGVGKSVVCANLATALAHAGATVIVFDADLGAPNLHTMFGITTPARTVGDFLEGGIDSLAEVALPTAFPRLRIICGNQSLGAANPKWQAKQKLIRQLGSLDAHCLLIDVGAGTSLNTVDFFNAADIRLLVLTPEITAVQNAYGFLKVALYRRLQRAIAGREVSDRLAEAFGGRAFEIASTMDSMETFFAILGSEAPELIAPFRMLVDKEFNARLIGNMLATPGDRDVIYAVQRLVKRFLGLDINVAATFRSSPHVRDSVNRGKPFALSADPDAAVFRQLARTLLEHDLEPTRRVRTKIAEALASEAHAITLGLDDIEMVEAGQLIEASQPTPMVPSAARTGAEVASASDHVDQLIGVEAAAVPREFTPLPIEDITGEITLVQRQSVRPVKQYVRVMLGGHWHLGTLVEIGDETACVSGIAATKELHRTKVGQLHLVTGDPSTALDPDDETGSVAVDLASYDERLQLTVLRFADADAASWMVEYVRARVPQ